MSRIWDRDTKLDKLIQSAHWKAVFRYLICAKRYPRKPDLIFPHYYAVIFINGCFWHAHGWKTGETCRYFRFPHSNQTFWEKKFTRNKERDSENIKYYQEQCWRICLVWECSIRGKPSEQIIQWLEEPEEAFLEIKG